MKNLTHEEKQEIRTLYEDRKNSVADIAKPTASKKVLSRALRLRAAQRRASRTITEARTHRRARNARTAKKRLPLRARNSVAFAARI